MFVRFPAYLHACRWEGSQTPNRRAFLSASRSWDRVSEIHSPWALSGLFLWGLALCPVAESFRSVPSPPFHCSSWGWQYFLLSTLKTSVGTGGLLRVGSRDESSFPGIPPLACTSLGLSFRDLKILFKLEGPRMKDELNFPTPSMVHINPIFIDCWGGGGPSRKWRDSPKTAAQRQR